MLLDAMIQEDEDNGNNYVKLKETAAAQKTETVGVTEKGHRPTMN